MEVFIYALLVDESVNTYTLVLSHLDSCVKEINNFLRGNFGYKVIISMTLESKY